MNMKARALAGVLAAAAAFAACEEKRFDPPDREQRVAQADSLYTPALFDTVTWESQEQRLFTGNDVFAAHCRRCHGAMGEGDTPYARERGIDVPSLVEPDWEHATDTDAVRRRIFTGHPGGMPTWGVAGIPPREIDAVAAYILEQLRPDVLGTGQAPAGR
jgi:mono/diheme cytochrome c family protein